MAQFYKPALACRKRERRLINARLMEGEMTLSLVLFMGATMWISLPGAVPRQFAQASEGSVLPSTAGHTLGAASMCEDIPEERIDAAADGVSAMVDRVVRSNAEVDSARAAFRQGAAAGRRAIASGASDCGRAADDLMSLEGELRSQSR